MVNKFFYGMRIPYINSRIFSYNEPKPGDVIVFIYPKDRSKDFIQRVIGTQGVTVQMVGGKIYIDNRPISDPWGYFDEKESPDFIAAVENFGPVAVPEGSLFVMGDNGNHSEDSRFWGFLPLNNVLGKSFIIYFSWDGKAGNLWGKVRWSRIGKLIH